MWYAIAGVIATGQLTYWTGLLFDVAKNVSVTASLCVALRYGVLAANFGRISLGKEDPESLDVHGIMIFVVAPCMLIVLSHLFTASVV